MLATYGRTKGISTCRDKGYNAARGTFSQMWKIKCITNKLKERTKTNKQTKTPPPTNKQKLNAKIACFKMLDIGTTFRSTIIS